MIEEKSKYINGDLSITLSVVLRHYKKTPEIMKSIIVVLFALVATTLAANTCLQGWDMHVSKGCLN